LHEFWSYNELTHVQTLVEFHHLCDLCHKIKHIGFWCHTADGQNKLRQEGYNPDDLIKHFCKVNGCSKEDFEKYEDECFEIWNKRSQYNWTQDFGEYAKYLKK
jgi:transposase-like protein